MILVTTIWLTVTEYPFLKWLFGDHIIFNTLKKKNNNNNLQSTLQTSHINEIVKKILELIQNNI